MVNQEVRVMLQSQARSGGASDAAQHPAGLVGDFSSVALHRVWRNMG